MTMSISYKTKNPNFRLISHKVLAFFYKHTLGQGWAISGKRVRFFGTRARSGKRVNGKAVAAEV